MDIFERAIYLALGGAIGFIVGYITRSLRDIKEELDDVDQKVTRHENDQRGIVRWPLAANVALGLVLVLSVWASIASQISSNRANDASDRSDDAVSRLSTLVKCNGQVLDNLVDASNDRTTYSADQIQANVALQNSFSTLLGVLLHQPPFDEARQEKAVSDYYSDLQTFVVTSHKTADQVKANPYPVKDALGICIANATK